MMNVALFVVVPPNIPAALVSKIYGTTAATAAPQFSFVQIDIAR